jgi:hypothetical protein
VTRKKNSLVAAQREVASAIRLAQSYALQGKAHNGATPCGYGFIFSSGDTDKKTYQVYLNPHVVGQNCDFQNSNQGYLHFNSQSVVLDKNILNLVKTTTPTTKLSTDNNRTDIYFTVPNGSVYSYRGTPFNQDEKHIITLEYAGSTATVTVDAKGGVTEDK